ncbi:hypothetical protein BC835DRAFT_1386821 [Cytidiella melzeri]|nr:hypothetical protein BC835DRAFT_1386821 [Cytidiella melzeri]
MQFLTTLVILATMATGISHITTVSAIPHGSMESQGHEWTASRIVARQSTGTGNPLRIRGPIFSKPEPSMLQKGKNFDDFMIASFQLNTKYPMYYDTYRRYMQVAWENRAHPAEHLPSEKRPPPEMFRLVQVLDNLPKDDPIRQNLAKGEFPRYTIEGGLEIIDVHGYHVRL